MTQRAFYEAGAPYQLSKTARQFIAGVITHGAEITAVTNQWVNSYEAPLGRGSGPLTWGHNNRSALVRVPMYKPSKGQSTRIEVRSLDSACNPYLAYAVILGAGLKGIEEGYLPPESEDDVWQLTDAERRAMGIKPLPESLGSAIEEMQQASSSPTSSASTSSTSSCATSGGGGTIGTTCRLRARPAPLAL